MGKFISIKKYRIRSGIIAADLFTSRSWDSLRRPLAVYLPGLPDFAGPTALTTALVERGVAVLQPHLAGTYDSDGLLSPDGCRDTLQQIWKAIANTGLTPVDSSAPISLDPTIISLIGHSFGGISALRYFNEFQGLDNLVFTSPALHYSHKDPDYGLKDDGRASYESVRTSHPYTYRLANIQEWDSIFRGTDPIPTEPIGTVRNIRVIYGEVDKYFDIGAVTKSVPNLINSYATATNNMTLDILQGAGHYLPELLSAKSVESLMPEVLGL